MQALITLAKSDSFWAVIGRLAALTTVLAGIAGAVVWFASRVRSGRSPIHVKGEYFNVGFPRPLQESVTRLVQALNPSEMKPYIAGDLTDTARMEAAMSLYRYFDGFLDANLKNGFSGLYSAWTFSIHNRGAKEIAGLSLEIPLKGVFVVRRNGTLTESGAFEQHIALGSLRGKSSLTVGVWAWYGTGSVWQEREARVTHPEGTAPATFPRKVWFIPGWLARRFSPQPAKWG